MSLLSKISTGKQGLPPRLTVYGPEGIGKSTFGNGAPAPIFLDVEGGLGEIDCARFPQAKTGDDIFAALAELRAADHPYRVRQTYPVAA
jgi:hypothetical protein